MQYFIKCLVFAENYYLCQNSNNHRNTKQSKELHTWGYQWEKDFRDC